MTAVRYGSFMQESNLARPSLQKRFTRSGLLLAAALLGACSAPDPTPTPAAASADAVAAAPSASIPPGAVVSSPPAETGTLTIKGALTYRARIALPKHAVAIVELRGESGAAGAVVAEQRIELQGRQVPIPFELVIPRAQLADQPPYQVRGGIVVSGRPEWTTALVVIDESVDTVDLGAWQMSAGKSGSLSWNLRCGEQTVLARFDPGAAQITIGATTHDLRPARAVGSGTRYVAVDDADTMLWNDAEHIRVKQRGRTLPDCVTQTDGDFAPLRATGNEPGWRLEIGAKVLTFSTADGNRGIETTTPLPRVTAVDQRVYATRVGRDDLTIDIAERLCVDSMTGMPHPDTVKVRYGGRRYAGCGGDPATLLQGTEWRATDIGGSLVRNSRATLSFTSDGRVTGRATCNAFGAEYSLTGERLLISRAAATMMACDAPLMQQEQQFLDLLQKIERFEITADGTLVLHAAGQRSITARRGL